VLSLTRSRRDFLQRGAALAGVGLLAGCGVFPSLTQRPASVKRIGYLAQLGPSPGPAAEAELEAFQQGLRDLGWIEGQNLTIEFRYAEGSLNRLPALADELVRAGVDLIYAPMTPQAVAAQQATKTIPIVFTVVADPVGQGLIASFAHPGGNVTGMSSFSVDLTAKRIQLLKEVAPGATRLGALRNTQNAGQPAYQRTMQIVDDAASAARLQVRYADLPGPDQAHLEHAFAELLLEHPDVLYIVPHGIFGSFQQQLAEFAITNRLPAIAEATTYAQAGLLLAYGPNFPDLFRRSAAYADKILKGANPADLPVEQPTKYDLAINVKTAQVLGLTIPQGVLAQVTEVIQ
jgi:putative ABC transport system substrate-binding protein